MPTTVPTASGAQLLGTRCPGRLVAGIRQAVAQHGSWQRTADLVSEQVRRHLPGPDVLTAQERLGDPS
jgi:hypothetical protein